MAAALRTSLVPLALALVSVAGCKLETREPSEGGEAPAKQAQAEDEAPEFALRDTQGETVSLSDLLGGGRPAVIVFYRGHW